ncbi:MAG: Rrf2 family transcriptional regulator [Pseudomonadota bacterium]
MQMSKGVEWAVHAAAMLAVLPEKAGLSADALARYHEVPPAYMAKQLQAMSRAGLVKSSRGARGGYRLAKPPGDISLWDIMAAIEGSQSAFRCTEIRQNGPCGAHANACLKPCPIASAFLAAETVFRDHLRTVTLVDITMAVGADATPGRTLAIFNWIDAERVNIGS